MHRAQIDEYIAVFRHKIKIVTELLQSGFLLRQGTRRVLLK